MAARETRAMTRIITGKDNGKPSGPNKAGGDAIPDGSDHATSGPAGVTG